MSLKGHHKVTQSNLLIDAKQRNPLGLQEWRIVLAMISMIEPSDKEFTTQRMSVRDFANLLNYKEPDYKKIKEACASLIEKNIEMKTKSGWLMTTWVSSAEYFSGDGIMEFTFSSKLKPYLLDMQETFTTYKLGHVLLLRSVYAIKLFELGKKRENMKPYKHEIEDLKQIIGAVATVTIDRNGKVIEKPEPYTQFADLKRRAILPAIKEINEKTDITIDFKEIKKGRKVVALEFTSRSKEKKSKPAIPRITNGFSPKSRNKKIIREEPVPDWLDKHKREIAEKYGED